MGHHKNKRTLFRCALDTISCLVMSIKCERAFSGVKKLITPKKNQLGNDIIEACGVVKKQPDQAAVWIFQEAEAVGGSEVNSFDSRVTSKVNTL